MSRTTHLRSPEEECPIGHPVPAPLQTCPLVAGLHSGDHDAVATDTDTGRLVGVLVQRDAIVVGVVCRQLAGVDAVVAQVRAAVALRASATSVSVIAHHDPDTDAVSHR